MTTTRRGVSLRNLLTGHTVPELTAHHIPDHGQPVRDVAIIADVDDILAVGPDSVVLLREELALGGWIVSVALRYAWERRAVAVVVPTQSFSQSVIDLARRFDVALLTANGIDRTALMLARELGALEAGVLTRLDAMESRVVRARTIQDVLIEISQEIGDGLVQVVVAGVELHTHGQRPPAAAEIRLPLARVASAAELVATVTGQQREFAVQALTRTVPTLRALLLEQDHRPDRRGAAPLLRSADRGSRQRIRRRSPPGRVRTVPVARRDSRPGCRGAHGR